jgi:hypothetical protein
LIFDFSFFSNTWNLQFFDPEKFPIPRTASSLVLILLGAFQKQRTGGYFKKLGVSKYPELAAIFFILKN